MKKQPNNSLFSILQAEYERLKKLTDFATSQDNPIIFMSLLQASNNLRVAASAAADNDEKLPPWPDKPTLMAQFFDYLNMLPEV